MKPVTPVQPIAAMPDPGTARAIDDVVERLCSLKIWAGDPSFSVITKRVNELQATAGQPASEHASRSTVVGCFRPGRRRLNTDLVIAVVRALHPDAGYVAQWRQTLRVIGGETQAAAQVRVQDALPPDLTGFTGRTRELSQLRDAAVCVIEGMAGVGKTQLAVRVGHQLVKEKLVDRVLFVNLRGFHPDPAQPPADPTAVLDGFLRLLGLPGQQIPHDLDARAAIYRDRLAGTRTLVVLDNAADAEQVRPLMPETSSCPVLITSRHNLSDLYPATCLTVDVFTPDEALDFLTRAAPELPVGADPDALARIARRCGYLPLALGLVAARMQATSGWTLTDHADRLDERHHDRRLEAGVEVALDLSYQHLPTDRRQLLRLLALHPGQDFDVHAVAALADADLQTAQVLAQQLRRDHLLHRGEPGRYTVHDLIRAYASTRACDEDRLPERRAALTRLFDHYLATTAAAMNILHPAGAQHRPQIPSAGAPIAAMANVATARAWLETERPTLIAVAEYTANHGWPTYSTRLSRTLFRYLDCGHNTDALTVHRHADHAARQVDAPIDQAHALTDLGGAYWRLGQYRTAVEHFQRALVLFRQAGDPAGEARALGNLGSVRARLGRYQAAADDHNQALTLYRQAGDRYGEASALGKLGSLETCLGRHRRAADRLQRALTVCRHTGDRAGEARALVNFADTEVRSGRYRPADERLRRALTMYRQIGERDGEAWTLEFLGVLHTRIRQLDLATEHHELALAIVRETGDRTGEASVLNSLGEAAHAAGRPSDAVTHHTAARTVAAEIGNRYQEASAHTGLGLAHHLLGNPAESGHHYQHAATVCADFGQPDADRLARQMMRNGRS